MKYRFVSYQDKQGLWRWCLKSVNGKIVADSGESYTTKANLKRAIKAMMEAV
jgi:uncharacterized protein YegP (UPF0339 family)